MDGALPRTPCFGASCAFTDDFSPVLISDTESEPFTANIAEIVNDTAMSTSVATREGRDSGDIFMSDSSMSQLNTSPAVLPSLNPGSALESKLPAPSFNDLNGAEVLLSPEQERVLNLVKSGRSVFFTGSAGTGKSVLLRKIIAWCESSNRSIAKTASTGIAAINIDGCTLHSWAGIGLGKESAERLAGKIYGQDKVLRRKLRKEREKNGFCDMSYDSDSEQNEPVSRVLIRWRECEVLIIDESETFDTFFTNLHLSIA